MNQFKKITVGFVVQRYEQGGERRFVCVEQEFVAGDQCDFEDAEGNPIEPPEHEYQPYTMTLLSEERLRQLPMFDKVYDAIEEVLQSLDVGGEQSRQFSDEIRTLRDAIGCPGPLEWLVEQSQRRPPIVEKLRTLALEAGGLTASLPTLPVGRWLDGTVNDSAVDVEFREYDLSALVRFIADVGVSHDD